MEFSREVSQAMEQYAAWLPIQEKPCDGALSEQEQLAIRHRLSIGGTAISSIIGLNPYQSASKLYAKMTDNIPPDPPNYKMMRGLALEETVATRAAQLLNLPLFYPQSSNYDASKNICTVQWAPKGCAQSDDLRVFEAAYGYSFISAQCDALVALHDGSLCILECKTTSRNVQKADGSYVWGKPLSLNDHGDILAGDNKQAVIPPYYLAQVQWQLLLLALTTEQGCAQRYNTEYAFLAVDIAGADDVALYKVHADKAMQLTMLESAAYFMSAHIMAGRPPLDYSSISTPAEGSEQEVYTADDDFLEAYEQLSEIKEAISKLNEQAAQLKESLDKALSFEHGAVIDKSGKLIARKLIYKQNRLDTKALANDDPDVYKRYLKQVAVTKVNYY